MCKNENIKIEIHIYVIFSLKVKITFCEIILEAVFRNSLTLFLNQHNNVISDTMTRKALLIDNIPT